MMVSTVYAEAVTNMFTPQSTAKYGEHLLLHEQEATINCIVITKLLCSAAYFFAAERQVP